MQFQELPELSYFKYGHDFYLKRMGLQHDTLAHCDMNRNAIHLSGENIGWPIRFELHVHVALATQEEIFTNEIR